MLLRSAVRSSVLTALASLALALPACDSATPEPPRPDDPTKPDEPVVLVATRLERAEPQTVTGTVGARLDGALRVFARTDAGEGVSDVAVTFRVVDGAASIVDATAATDADGQASASVQFERPAGLVTVEASADGLAGSPVTFALRADWPDVSSGLLATLSSSAADLVLDPSDGTLYVSLPDEDVVVVLAAESGDELARIEMLSRPYRMDLSTDGQTLYVAMNGIGSVGVIDLDTKSVRYVTVTEWTEDLLTFDVEELTPGVIAVSASPGVFGSASVAEVVVDTGAGRQLANGPRFRPTLAATADGQTLYIGTNASPNSLLKVDVPTARIGLVSESDREDGPPAGASWLALTPTGDRVLLGTGSVHSTLTFKLVGQVGVYEGGPQLPGPGGVIYRATGEGAVGVFDDASYAELRSVPIGLSDPSRMDVWTDRLAAYVLDCPRRECDRVYAADLSAPGPPAR